MVGWSNLKFTPAWRPVLLNIPPCGNSFQLILQLHAKAKIVLLIECPRIVGILIVFPPFVGIPYKWFHVNAKLYFRSNLKLLNNVSIVVGIFYSSIKSGPCKDQKVTKANIVFLRPSHKTVSCKSAFSKANSGSWDWKGFICSTDWLWLVRLKS